MPLRFTWVLLATFAGCVAHAQAPSQARPPRPAPYCLDARDVREAHQADARTLALRLGDDSRYRLELADDCPGAVRDGDAALVARDGWVCGLNEEHVRAGERRCAVAGLARIDAEAFARLAVAGRRVDGVATLAPVQVKGEWRRGFAGSSAYCLDARQMRGWHEDGDGVVVEVSPRRNAGHRRYRVELVASCPELARAESITLRSGMGLSAICGNPGDRVVVAEELQAGASLPIASSLGLRGEGCAISLVYPIDTATAPARDEG